MTNSASDFARFRVPATSANLGPGFDILGMASTLFNALEAQRADEFSVQLLPGTCVDASSMSLEPERNLLVRAYRYYFESLGKSVIPAAFGVEAHIPFSRGLGSSSTAIIAGLLLADALSERQRTQTEILKMAIELEGHSDNVTPALLGGLQCCFPNQPQISLAWPEDWGLIFVIPPTPLSTKKARAVLPDSYPEHVLEENQHNLSQWIEALQQQDMGKFKIALMSDQLHEPYRQTLIPEYAVLKSLLESTDAMGCVISGAGSTLLAVTPSEITTKAVLDTLKQNANLSHCKIIRLQPSPQGAHRVESANTLDQADTDTLPGA